MPHERKLKKYARKYEREMIYGHWQSGKVGDKNVNWGMAATASRFLSLLSAVSVSATAYANYFICSGVEQLQLGAIL